MKYLIVISTWDNEAEIEHSIAIANSIADATEFVHKLDNCLRAQNVASKSKRKIRKFVFNTIEYEIYSSGCYADFFGICDVNDAVITQSVNKILKPNRYRVSFNDNTCGFNLYCDATDEKDAAIKVKKICSLPIASIKKLK